MPDAQSRTDRRRGLWVSAAVFAAALVVRLWGLSAMGNVWDEYFYYDAARSYLHNVIALDVNPDHWQANFEHPPLGKYLVAPGIVWNHLVDPATKDAYTSPRTVSAIFGALTVVVVWLIGRRFWSEPVGLAAATIYGLLPAVIAYSQIIDLDVSMTLWFTLAGYWLLAWLEDHRDHSLWWSILFACLAVASKFNAVLFGLVALAALIADRFDRPTSWRLPPPFLLSPVVIITTVVAIWPWLWHAPLQHFALTLHHWDGIVRELYFGQYRTPGGEYFLVHFVVGTPLIILALASYGLGVARSKWTTRHSTLVAWLVGPFAISLFHLRQDHLRYVLTSYPALAILAALGLWALVDRLSQSWRPAQWAVPATVAVSLIWTIVWIHPYYLNYYNPLVGGTKGVVAHERFELGFYGEGIKEATEFVNRTAVGGATVHYEVIPDDAPYLDRPRLTRLDTPPGADYLIVNSNALHDPTKRDNFSLVGYHVVYEVRAAGAPFVWIYQRNAE